MGLMTARGRMPTLIGGLLLLPPSRLSSLPLRTCGLASVRTAARRTAALSSAQSSSSAVPSTSTLAARTSAGTDVISVAATRCVAAIITTPSGRVKRNTLAASCTANHLSSSSVRKSVLAYVHSLRLRMRRRRTHRASHRIMLTASDASLWLSCAMGTAMLSKRSRHQGCSRCKSRFARCALRTTCTAAGSAVKNSATSTSRTTPSCGPILCMSIFPTMRGIG